MPQDRLEQARMNALSLYQEGVQAQTIGEYVKAEDCYRRCHTMMKAIGNRNGEAASLHYMGTLLEAKGDFEEALDCYQKSFVLFQEEQDFQNCIFSLFFQAMLSLKMRQHGSSIELLLEAIEMAFLQGASYVQESWNRVRQMAGVLFARRQIEEMIVLGDRLVALGERLSEQDDGHPMQRQLGQITNKIGILILACGRFWSPSEDQAEFPEAEIVSWLLQTAVNLDQSPGTGLAFTDLVAKVIQERPAT